MNEYLCQTINANMAKSLNQNTPFMTCNSAFSPSGDSELGSACTKSMDVFGGNSEARAAFWYPSESSKNQTLSLKDGSKTKHYSLSFNLVNHVLSLN